MHRSGTAILTVSVLLLSVVVALPKRDHSSEVRWNGGKLILVQPIREPKQSVGR